MEIKIRKRGMADNIPFEMQVEIMKRLPVKSLAVFRSVSKAWKSVIDSRLFIADYTNFHQHHRLLIRYMIDYQFGCYDKYVSIVDNDTLSHHEFDIVNTNVPESVEQLVGTSQGLLCLFGDYGVDGCVKKTAVIWNPSLGKSIAIDVPSEDMRGVTVLGFGVRPDNIDPMIVMINYVEHCYHQVMVFTLSSRVWRVRGKLPPKSLGFQYGTPVATDRCIYWKASEVMVFTLSSRVWRVRGKLPPKSLGFQYGTPVATDRCIYWKASEVSINLVVAFDMVSEDFTEIHLPHSVAHRESYNFSISKIKDSLALLEYSVNAKKPVCDVWMMVEDGVSKSFTKLFTINTPYASLKPKVLGFRKNDQPIMETVYKRSTLLELYEPRTGTIKKTGIDVQEGSSFMSSYTETLLLLDQLDGQVVTIQLLDQSS